jgi:3-methylcrotonyl-CoA carboxylase alpha subunit
MTIRTLLVANRGEIALRVMRTARRIGIRTVAVFTDLDADAPHVRAADEAVRVASYLDIDGIVAAALGSGADAVHPGYGFLSERAPFAAALEAAGVTLVGPSAAVMEQMGRKDAAREIAVAAGVPVVPQGQPTDEAAYPVLVKAAAGGGGKGMRIVRSAADYAEAVAAARREAASAFGDDAMLVERYVEHGRHIEVQVIGDTHGTVLHLFERDCSTQRRHQKVLEEAPAPGMPEAMRRQMGEAAVSAARAVNYVGAGTVEFIVEQRPDGSMNFFFMEMNTRLQVEHPVTEAITGLDLVEWQLRVASGEPLPLRQDQLTIQGHAIEARICAENPDKQFLPATGTLHAYQLPDCVRFERGPVRVDSGVREGDAISPFYDSMIAKLIVHGDTREEALARLDQALAAMRVVGVQNNVQFLRHVLASRSFAEADLDTALIQRESAVLFDQEPLGRELAVAGAVAQQLHTEQAAALPVPGAWADPWGRRDGWRAYTPMSRRIDYQFRGEEGVAELCVLHDGALQLRVGETSGVLDFGARADGRLDLQFAGRRVVLGCVRQGETVHLFAPQGATQVLLRDALAHAGEHQAEGGRLTAPMPGKVVSFSVQAGDKVTKGQALAVMEAMKMEHTIAAPADGTVAELLYAPGDQVAEGAELLKLAV